MPPHLTLTQYSLVETLLITIKHELIKILNYTLHSIPDIDHAHFMLIAWRQNHVKGIQSYKVIIDDVSQINNTVDSHIIEKIQYLCGEQD